MENLRILKERSDATSPPSDMQETSAYLMGRTLEQKQQLREAEEDQADAVKCFAVVNSSLTKHKGHIEAFNMMKKTQFEVTNRDRRSARVKSVIRLFYFYRALNGFIDISFHYSPDLGRAAKRNWRKAAGY